MSDKPPKLVRIESPGEGFWEQIEKDGEYCYAFFKPPTILTKTETIEYDTFQPSYEKSEEENIVIHYIPLKKVPWPLPGEPIKPTEDLWMEIHGFIYRHVDLPDERLYHVLTAWVFCTWILERWIAVPYLHLQGPKKSGKTRVQEVLKYLCYRGILAANISEAALYRTVESFKPTLLLDETEIYSKETRESVQNLLNSGYRRGQYVIRVGGVNTGNLRLDLFEVFGFKSLAGTGGFKDTLESRSIRIPMEKNIRPVEPFLDLVKAKELRSQLLYWRFQRLSDVSDDSDVSPGVVPEGLDYPDGRFVELFTPLVLVANDGRADILLYAREVYGYMIDEEQTTIEATVLLAVIKCFPFLVSGKFPVSLVLEKFNEDRTEKEQWGTRSLGRVIRSLGFRPKRMTGGKRGYVYDVGLVTRLANRYGTPPVETSLTSLTSLEDQEQADFTDRRNDNFERLAEEGA